jgi:hypothetical protein
MAERSAADIAFERAWSIYLLINTSVEQNDARRALLQRFIRKWCEAGEGDLESLVVAGLKHLKMLDQSGDDFADDHTW